MNHLVISYDINPIDLEFIDKISKICREYENGKCNKHHELIVQGTPQNICIFCHEVKDD